MLLLAVYISEIARSRISHVDIKLSTACTHVMYHMCIVKKKKNECRHLQPSKRWNLRAENNARRFLQKINAARLYIGSNDTLSYRGTHEKKSEILWVCGFFVFNLSIIFPLLIFASENRIESFLAEEFTDEWQNNVLFRFGIVFLWAIR